MGDSIERAEQILHSILFHRFKNIVPEIAGEIESIFKKHSWSMDIQLEEPSEYSAILVEDGKQHGIGLQSIFSQLQLFEKEKPARTFYPAEPWIDANQFPQSMEPSRQDVLAHWEESAREYIKLLNAFLDDPRVRLAQFLDYADIWLSSVPASGQLSSISFSEFLKIAGAIAVADKGNGKFKLMIGDISGIQSYLFDVAHIGAGKVAKRLRARSFVLGLIAEASAHRLLLDEKLPISNLILSAGGSFYLILPEDADTRKWKASINDYLYHRYHGAIGLYTAERKASLEEMTVGFHEFIQGLYEDVSKDKANPFGNVLVGADGWNEEEFLHDDFSKRGPCKSCRKFPEERDEFCSFCLLDEKLGKLLPQVKGIAYIEGVAEEKDSIYMGNGIYVQLYREAKDINRDAYFYHTWNNRKTAAGIDIPFKMKWTTNYIPVASASQCEFFNRLKDSDEKLYPGAPLTFSHMAQASKGKKQIAYFKADIDRLGMLFSTGFYHPGQSQSHTLYHTVMLSRMLERFFAGKINALLEEKYVHTYTVFSGGDDLFLIGPWSEIIEAAKEIEMLFKSYIGKNKEITMSASINIVKPGTPIPHAAKVAEETLEMAKDMVSLYPKDKNAGRNQVTLISTVMTWDEFKRINDDAIQLSTWWSGGKLTSSFLYQMSNFSKMFKDFIDTGDNQYLKFVPLYVYYVERNLIETKKLNEKYDKPILDWIRKMENISDPYVEKLWIYMDTVIRLSYLYRKEG